MGNILSFPQEKRKPAEDFSFVNDGETLDFDGDEADIQLDRTGAAQDWNNQELADLYRVKHLLDQAGIACETDRGVSDEGDPWFVFMRADGEVFIHFCRIHGTYYLDSPNLDRALKGQDARALVAAYTSKVVARTDTGHDPKTVVPLRSGGGQVSLHPAVMLAALVWSLLIGAEDALSLPAIETPDTSDHMIPEVPRLGASDTVPDTVQSATVATEDATANPQAETQSARDSLNGSNGYATGLSAIAIGIGVLADRGLDLLDDTSLEQIFQYLSGSGAAAGPSNGETDRSALSSAAEINAMDVLVKITQMPVGPDMLLEGRTTVGTVAADGPRGAEGLMASTGTVTTDSAEQLPAQIATAPANVPPFGAPDRGAHKTTSLPVSDDVSDTQSTALLASSPPTPSQSPSAQSTSAAPSYEANLVLSEIRVGESLLHASFAVTETLLEKFDVTDVLSEGTADMPSEPYLTEDNLDAGSAFDLSRTIEEMGSGDAWDIVQTLVERQTDLEIADSGNWLWIVEADAQYAPLDQTVSKVFNTDDGARIMITGLQTTFADADLVSIG